MYVVSDHQRKVDKRRNTRNNVAAILMDKAESHSEGIVPRAIEHKSKSRFLLLDVHNDRQGGCVNPLERGKSEIDKHEVSKDESLSALYVR